MNAIRTGIAEINRRKKIVWTWYVLSLLCSIVIVAPMVAGIAGFLGTSLENRRLFENFDMSFIAEFGWHAQWEQFIFWLPVMALTGAAFVFMTIWLSGGILAVLRDPGESFFAGCARWFPPFFRLFLFALIGYAVAFGVRAASTAAVKKIAEDSMSAQPSAYGSMIGFVLFWTVFLFVNMIVDYAKIHMVVRGDRAARRGLRGAIRFVFANFRRTATIYFVLTCFGLLMLAVYHGVSELVGQGSMGAVLVVFVVRQVYMWGRNWLRLVFLASEHAYFMSRLPKPPQPVPEPVLPLQESFEFNESV
jgi:hypothetical protein